MKLDGIDMVIIGLSLVMVTLVVLNGCGYWP